MIQKPRLYFATAAIAATTLASLLTSSSVLALQPTATPGLLTPAAARALADRAVNPAQLKDYLSFIASDELQGRDTPSNGLNTAAKFIATNLSRWGFKPAGDDSTFYQKIPLTRSRVDAAATHAALSGKPLAYPDEFVLSAGRGRGGAPANADVADAPLVYVGQGWVLPQRGTDPYKGIEVRGKVMVVSQLIGQRFPGGPGLANAVSAQQYGAAHGAVGIAYLSDSADVYSQFRADAVTPRGGFSVAAPSSATPRATAQLPSIILSPQASQQLFTGEKIDSAAAVTPDASGKDAASFDFTAGKKLAMTVRYTTENVNTQNVVAVWEGSDSALKNEYVAFGAHYDHLGMSATPDANGDTIYNGADDDGSGTTALLAMADTLHQSPLRPRRSVLFVWHCGEEKGLWGSSYFTDHPTVPLDHVSAQLNIDMIGRSKKADDTIAADANLSGPHEIYVIGSRMMSTQLGTLADRVNKGYQNLAFNYVYDDPNDPNRFFYRSDHINYARKGVPIIFWFDGVHEDYHRRSDEVAKIDFVKMTAVTRTVFLTMTEIADLPKKLVVDKAFALPGGGRSGAPHETESQSTLRLGETLQRD